MKRYTPRKGDRVSADGKNGPFTILKVNAKRAVANLELIGKVAGKRYIVRDIPFGHIHPLGEELSQTAARIVRRATENT